MKHQELEFCAWLFQAKKQAFQLEKSFAADFSDHHMIKWYSLRKLNPFNHTIYPNWSHWQPLPHSTECAEKLGFSRRRLVVRIWISNSNFKFKFEYFGINGLARNRANEARCSGGQRRTYRLKAELFRDQPPISLITYSGTPFIARVVAIPIRQLWPWYNDGSKPAADKSWFITSVNWW